MGRPFLAWHPAVADECFIVDGLAACFYRPPGPGQVTVGAQARLMSAALRKIAGNAARHNTTIIFLNQLRQKVCLAHQICAWHADTRASRSAVLAWLPRVASPANPARRALLTFAPVGLVHGRPRITSKLSLCRRTSEQQRAPARAADRGDLREPRGHERRPGAQVLRVSAHGGAAAARAPARVGWPSLLACLLACLRAVDQAEGWAPPCGCAQGLRVPCCSDGRSLTSPLPPMQVRIKEKITAGSLGQVGIRVK